MAVSMTTSAASALDAADWFASLHGELYSTELRAEQFWSDWRRSHCYSGRPSWSRPRASSLPPMRASPWFSRCRKPINIPLISALSICTAVSYTKPELPAIAAVLNAFPPTDQGSTEEIIGPGGNPTGLAQSLIYDALFPAHVNSTSVRIDHTFTPKLSLFVRFGDTPSYAQSNQLFSVTTSQLNTHTWTVGGAAQFSASHSNEFRLGYVGSSLNASTTPEQISGHENPPPAGNINAALGVPSTLNVAPGVARTYAPASAEAYVHITGVGDSGSNSNQITSSLGQWNLRDTYSLQSRNHLFRFGLDEQHIVSHFTPPPLSILADFFTLDSLAEQCCF